MTALCITNLQPSNICIWLTLKPTHGIQIQIQILSYNPLCDIKPTNALAHKPDPNMRHSQKRRNQTRTIKVLHRNWYLNWNYSHFYWRTKIKTHWPHSLQLVKQPHWFLHKSILNNQIIVKSFKRVYWISFRVLKIFCLIW